MRRTLIAALVATALSDAAYAQIPVSDPGNLAQAVLIADRTRREFDALVAQYQTLLRMSRSLGSLDRYRIPGVPASTHDVTRWRYAQPWLQALNVGDATGSAYRETVRRLTVPGATLASLPGPARRALEAAYATVEITDAVTQAAAHQVGLARVYRERLQSAVDALERDVVSPAPERHEMTAVLDKVAAGALIGRRQDMAVNQLLSHTVEQLVSRSKRLRDAEAASMNMRLGAMRDGRVASSAIVRGASDDLRTWRQP
jgi:hypothetical protein